MASEYVPYEGLIVTRAEAKAAGLTRYFTGKPCLRGHISERRVAKGECVTCKAAAVLAEYHANPVRKAKVKAAKTLWKRDNRRSVNDKQKIWRKANKDHCREQRREANKRNPERQVAKSARYYAANAEARRAATMAWSAANPELKKLAIRRWRTQNPEQARIAAHNMRARRSRAEGSHTAQEVRALMMKQRGRCAYCRVPLATGYHKDHIVPLARGGTNWIANIQLTCPKCNFSKNRSDPLDFAKKLGKLL